MAKKQPNVDGQETPDAAVAETSAIEPAPSAPAADAPEPVAKSVTAPEEQSLLFVSSEKTHDLHKLNAAYNAQHVDRKRRQSDAVKKAQEALERAIRAAQE